MRCDMQESCTKRSCPFVNIKNCTAGHECPYFTDGKVSALLDSLGFASAGDLLLQRDIAVLNAAKGANHGED